MKSASNFPTKSPFEVGLTISTPTREVAAETFNDLLVEFELSNGIDPVYSQLNALNLQNHMQHQPVYSIKFNFSLISRNRLISV